MRKPRIAGKRDAPGEKLVPVSFRIPRAIKEEAEQLAWEDNRSMASVVAMALASYIASRRKDS